MNFESELSKGILCIPKCSNCNQIVWPPVDFCSHCLGKVILEKGDFYGKILEFSKQDDYFCLVEFEGKARVIAKMKQIPKIGQKVRIVNCGITKGNYFFEVSSLNN